MLAEHHRGHAPYQWQLAVKLMSIGYDFVNDHERDKCLEGETSLMEMKVEESVVEYNRESHGTNLTIKVYNMK